MECCIHYHDGLAPQYDRNKLVLTMHMFPDYGLHCLSDCNPNDVTMLLGVSISCLMWWTRQQLIMA